MPAYYTVVFNENGQMIRGFESNAQGAMAEGVSVVEPVDRAAEDRMTEVTQRRVKNITSVSIVTTQNPHACFWQGDKEICLGH